MSLYENLNKDELIDLMKAYDCYIATAADAGRFETGWVPVCISEFYSCEYQDVWRQGQNFDYMFQDEYTQEHDPDLLSLKEIIQLKGVRIFTENGNLMCHFGTVGDKPVMHKLQDKIQDIKQGDAFIVGTKVYCATEDAHQNFDEPDKPWIVYDQCGDSWFEEDITPAWEGVEKILDAKYASQGMKRPLRSLMETANIRSAAGIELPQKLLKIHGRSAGQNR